VIDYIPCVSSVSSATNGSQGSTKSGKCSGPRIGYPRQPTGSLRKSQTQAMKLRIQEYKEPSRTGKDPADKPTRLPPIKEFQREFRSGKERTSTSSSTRIRFSSSATLALKLLPSARAKSYHQLLGPKAVVVRL
ncbi:hypothetical protein L9F63_020767, partial [Diploptera punctata]